MCEPLGPGESPGGKQLALELVQVPAKPLLDATALGDQVLAVIDQQANLALGTGQPGAGQVGLLQGRAGHGEGVHAVGLAPAPASSAQGGHQLGRNAHHLLAAGKQQPLQASRHVPAVLDAEQALDAEAPAPGKQPAVTLAAGGDGELGDQLAGAPVHRTGGVAGLVGVDPDHDHRVAPCRLP